MNFIVGTLLMYLSEEESFWMLNTLTTNYGLRDMLITGFPKNDLINYQLGCLINAYLPKLHKYLKRFEITPSYFTPQWFITLFSYDLATK